MSDPETGQKDFWTAFKRISNKKKLTNIPPIFENNRYIPNFQQKADIFNAYFADQCNIYDNGSPSPAPFSRANASVSHVNITHNQIVDIIQKCSSKKALGCAEISVAMLHLCASEMAYPLRFDFSKMYDKWQISRFLEVCQCRADSQKGNRQLKMNYRPISLLPICGKILENIVFDQVYSFLNVNNLLSNNQSGFRPGDSAIYQLISITSIIYETFEKYDETRALFLDIPKAFDKVWHDEFIFKLKCNGISRSLFSKSSPK